MLQNDKRLIKCDVDSARKIKAAAMDTVTIKARPYMMDDFNLRIVNKLRSSLPGLKRQREFPIDLGPLPSQVGFESSLPQKIAPKQKV